MMRCSTHSTCSASGRRIGPLAVAGSCAKLPKHPKHVGTGFTLIRAHALAAIANHALGIPHAVRDELAEAERLLATREGYAFLSLVDAS